MIWILRIDQVITNSDHPAIKLGMFKLRTILKEFLSFYVNIKLGLGHMGLKIGQNLAKM